MSNTDTDAQAQAPSFRWPSDTPTKAISIYEQEFTVPQPYKEGHVLTSVEAKVLNQTFAENIGNNQRSSIKKGMEGVEGATLEEATARFNDYAWSYQFTEAGVGGSSRTLTPVEREARTIARAHIMAELSKSGRKRKDVDDDKFEAEVARIASIDKIIKLAEKNVRQRQKAQDEVANLLAEEAA